VGSMTSEVGKARVPEPLARFAPGFEAALLEAGYSPQTVVVHLRLMGHLSRWLAARELSGAELTAERIEAYLSSRRAAGYRGPRTRRGLDPLVAYLAG
jgi:integrase/recombinase XerD